MSRLSAPAQRGPWFCPVSGLCDRRTLAGVGMSAQRLASALSALLRITDAAGVGSNALRSIAKGELARQAHAEATTAPQGVVGVGDDHPYARAYRHWAKVADVRLGVINRLLRHVPAEVGRAILRDAETAPRRTAGDHDARGQLGAVQPEPLPVGLTGEGSPASPALPPVAGDPIVTECGECWT